MADVQYGNGVPFDEAIQFLRRKLNIPTDRWDQMMGEAHSKAFTVAGATKLDLLSDMRQAVDDALANGLSITEFRKRFDDIVQKHGWSYKGSRGWRTRVIYDTNLRTASMAGRWEQIQKTKDERPYLQYRTAGDNRVRPQHRAWDRITLTVDDKWWDTHYPPNGWGCRCSVRTLSQSEIEREGITISKAPLLDATERINPGTGEVYGMVPKGIDPGWDYNVGQSWLNWDRSALFPECFGVVDFAAGDATPCIAIVPGQKTWKDVGRPDLRQVPVEDRIDAPLLLPKAPTIEDAVIALKNALGMTEDFMAVETVIDELVIFQTAFLRHTVEKRQDARETFANFILPTLQSPFEVWGTEYTDGIRTRYIGVFTGDTDVAVIVRRNKDGSLFWNFMQTDDRRLNRQRVGDLIYIKGR